MTTTDYAKEWGQRLTPAPVDVTNDPPKRRSALVDGAREFIHWAQNPQDRVTLGIDVLDAEMRGIAPGEFCLLVGYSHSGKTMTLMEILRHNKKNRVIYFCPDEPAPLTLVKLASVEHGVAARDLERKVAARDGAAVDLLMRTATDSFANLSVCDQPVGLNDMERYLAEQSDEWGDQPQLVVFDYLELLGSGEDVPSQANQLKAWGRRHNVPMLVLHQTSRTSGAAGKQLTISSGAYGGEQQATHLIGVRRKKFEIESQIIELEGRANPSEATLERIDELRYLLRMHQSTVTVALLKNKRPDASLMPEVDFEIEKGTGRLRPLLNGELPQEFLNADGGRW